MILDFASRTVETTPKVATVRGAAMANLENDEVT
tara:strand:- start:2591 stop:2692 length:102 start_codon:yes stop_codon:yes gene_type:complete